MSGEILVVESVLQLKCISHSLPEPTVDEIAEFYKDDCDLLADALADCLPSPDVIMKTSPANYVSTKFDFSSLIDLRRAHETNQAKNSCRTQQNIVPERASQKQEILRAFNAILRQNKEKRFGSGLHRQQQYGSSAATTGNSASAELVATVWASKVGSALVSQCTHFSRLSSQRPRQCNTTGSHASSRLGLG